MLLCYGVSVALLGTVPYSSTIPYLLPGCRSHASGIRTMSFCLLEFWGPLHKVSDTFTANGPAAIRAQGVWCAHPSAVVSLVLAPAPKGRFLAVDLGRGDFGILGVSSAA